MAHSQCTRSASQHDGPRAERQVPSPCWVFFTETSEVVTFREHGLYGPYFSAKGEDLHCSWD